MSRKILDFVIRVSLWTRKTSFL